MWGTIGVLFLFMVINLLGVKESSVVAVVIFVGHLLTLAILVVVAIVYIAQHPTTTYNTIQYNYMKGMDRNGTKVDNVDWGNNYGFVRKEKRRRKEKKKKKRKKRRRRSREEH